MRGIFETMTVFTLVFALFLGSMMLVSSISAQTIVMPPPADLYAGADQIALESSQSPDRITTTATYGNEADTARVALRIMDADDTIGQWMEWGRLTTADSVNNQALGIVPAWRVPATFDRAAFQDATGCTDARMVATDTPRADIDTGEMGHTADFAQPALDHPIAAAIALCLTPDGQIVQLLNVHLTSEQPLAATVDLMAGAVTWLAAVPDEGDDAPAATCDPDDGEFRVAIIDEGC